MRIGIVTTWFERGAAYVSRQYAQLLSPEHEVFIFARGGELPTQTTNEWSTPNLFVAKPTYRGLTTEINLNEFRNWITQNKIEIVLFNEQHWWSPIKICDELSIPCGAYVDYYTSTTVPFFEAYDFLICNTKRHYSIFRDHRNVLYLPWGANLQLFTAKEKTIETPYQLFHSCGVSPERKGTDTLIKAFYLSTSTSRNRLHLTIHSQVPLLQFFDQTLKMTVSELVNSGQLTLIEKTISAPGLYNNFDVYIYPSRLDGIGLSLCEALASGLPAVTTDEPPMNEFISKTEGPGWLIPVTRRSKRKDGYYWPLVEVSEKSLADVLNQISDIQPDQLAQLKRQARDYCETQRDWNKNKKPLQVFLEHIRLNSLERKSTQNTERKKIVLNQALSFDRDRTPFFRKFVGLTSFLDNAYLTYKKITRGI